ncbi:uncharacterized protein BDV14DRAFT_50382 [Aspergillus stella-maris]|uniref:uncharacterized protein n=1 Tax=Aspergillus stella-maris TaxID=1810926 RepID=UPI003CCE164C
MNWTGGRLRRHAETNAKPRTQTFGSKSKSKSCGLHHITLFNSLGKGIGNSRQDTEGPASEAPKSGPHHNASQSTTGNPRAGQQTQPNTNPTSSAISRLDKMKRHLLETTDWASVGAAKPVEMSFTPEADIERFGKRRRLTMGDHARLNTTRGSPRIQSHLSRRFEGAGNNCDADGIPEGLEIRIDGRRLGQEGRADAGVDTSQSMLLEEESQGSNRTRHWVGTSIHSGDQQLDSSQLPFIPKLQFNDHGFPITLPREFSESMEPEPEPLVSNESTGSSIIPRTASPVRRRFTIDDQAIADREGRFDIFTPVNGPKAGPRIRQPIHYQSQPEYEARSSETASPGPGSDLQLMHDKSYEGLIGRSFEAALHPESRLDAGVRPHHFSELSVPRQNHQQVDQSLWSRNEQSAHRGSDRAFMLSSPEAVPSMTGQTQALFGWLPQMHKAPRTQRPVYSQLAEPSKSQIQNQAFTSSPWPESEANRLVPDRTYARAHRGVHQTRNDEQAAADLSPNGCDTLLH